MTTRAEAVELAWELGHLYYMQRIPQRRIKEKWIASKDVSRKFYIETTRRLGKSSFLLILFIEECISRPNRKCGFFAPVKDGLLDYIEPLIRKILDDCPERLRPVFDRQRFMLRFANGSTIIFRGSNNQQHRIRRGQEFHLAGIDEARDVSSLDDLVESVVMPSLFSTDGHLIISSTPADTRSHPLFAIRTRAKLEGWFINIDIWSANHLDPTTYPIDLINEWKAETLRAPDGQEIWEREFECKWVINRRKMAVPEWQAKYVQVPEMDPYKKFYRRFHGLDWGFKDYTAVVFATHNFRKSRIEFEGELGFTGKDVRSDLISERINQANEDIWGEDYVRSNDFVIGGQISDSADPILINEINKFRGMAFYPVKKDSLEAMMNEFRMLVSAGKIIVHPRCQMLIHCLETAIWDDKREKLDKDVFAHHFDHLMAAVYLTRMVDWNHNPMPRDYMIDNIRTIDLNFDKSGAHTKSAKALEAAFAR